MKVLFTAIGKRVQLIQHFKSQFEVVGVDVSEKVAARDFVDTFYKVPKCEDKNYAHILIEICKREQIGCVIPLYEKEFSKLCKFKDQFESNGTKLLLSSYKIIEICNNKLSTIQFFEKHNIRQPKYYYNKIPMEFPVIIKPREGMGSRDVFKAINQVELEFFSKYVTDYIVQEYIEGAEYTIDVLCDFNGNPIYIVPRKRMEVRGGEVSKSQIILDENIIKQVEYILKCLNQYKDERGQGVQGPLTLQCFKKQDGNIVLLEINPRLGGGVPLSFEAGANYSKSIFELLQGRRVERKYDFKSLMMLRYDEAVFK